MKRMATALSVVALVGCGTAQRKPPAATDVLNKEQTTNQTGTGGRAVKGAAGGAAAGALACLSIAPAGLPAGPVGLAASTLAALVCLPFGAAAGAVVGGSVAASSSPTAVASTPGTPAEVAARFRTHGRFVLVASGQVPPGDVLPAGALHVAMNTIAAADGAEKRASLVIDFDTPTKDGARSQVVQTLVSCDTGTAALHHSMTYGEAYGHGPLVKALEHVPPVGVKEPSTAVAMAIRAVCEAGPWWNQPTQTDRK